VRPIGNHKEKMMNALTFRTPTLERIPSKAGRMYILPDGRHVPGVTTVLEVINKPALVHWAASEERKHCLEIATQTFIALTGEDGAAQFMTPENFHALLAENLGKTKAHYRVMKKAQNIGTEAHACIEWHIRQQLRQSVGPRPIISDKAELAVMAWSDWAKSVKFEPLAVEFMIYSDFHGYGGTIDLVARINGIPSLLDWKTGKAIYQEAHLQNAAYLAAVKRLPGVTNEPWQGAIVRLPKELEDVGEIPFEVKIIPESEHRPNFIAFLKALDLFRWVHGLPQPPRPTQAAPRRYTQPQAQQPIKPWLRKPSALPPVPASR
jgi:hypothetical protein